MPADEDECVLRDNQWDRHHSWRALRSTEIETLTQQGNTNPDWSTVRVTERFNPKLVRGCRFGGFVRIGDLESLVLDFEGLRLPVGLYHSTIIASDIGNNVRPPPRGLHGQHADRRRGDPAWHRSDADAGRGPSSAADFAGKASPRRSAVGWISATSPAAAGSRRFEGILPADAWLWSKYRADGALMDRLREITDLEGNRAGIQYGVVGSRTVIRNTRSLVNVRIGPDSVIDGANRLENVTVRGDAQEGTFIGEGANLSDGIVGFGCQVGSGVTAERFVLGTNVRLQNGARLLHSFLGDNSTVACCEVANSLIFPNHEQHHNNSFLIAATVQGQSNIAAGATIGSNHNSRAADGELLAERGFWAGPVLQFQAPQPFCAVHPGGQWLVCLRAQRVLPLQPDFQ